MKILGKILLENVRPTPKSYWPKFGRSLFFWIFLKKFFKNFHTNQKTQPKLPYRFPWNFVFSNNPSWPIKTQSFKLEASSVQELWWRKKFKSSLVSYVTSSFISCSRRARAHWLSNRNPQPPSCYADGRTFRRFFELIFNSPSFILKNILIRMNHI